ncbi:Phospholipase A2 [Pseudolycoriella hygida]|uniref:Phospholipase A2 n=1 Tax=Pseudolycoriella hygida TaxID=35572 RepID=A0A9Q0N7Z3_9DIPT|nr:Phospholipase A2 [Pseudolycoriella hygida]
MSDCHYFQDELEDLKLYTHLSNYDENFYNQMHDRNNVINSNNLGLFQKFLTFIGYPRPSSTDEKIMLRPHKISSQTDGLDVRLKFLFEISDKNESNDSDARQLQLILPGTLWCGDGNTAQSDQDLGLFSETDHCCRQHDFCPTYIEAGQSFMNLENVGIFTRSLCECDFAFYKCLKKVDSILSNRIGQTYFNVLKPQCFSEEYPIVGCIKKRKDSRCENYVIDDSRYKIWQWFDSKKY